MKPFAFTRAGTAQLFGSLGLPATLAYLVLLVLAGIGDGAWAVLPTPALSNKARPRTA